MDRNILSSSLTGPRKRFTGYAVAARTKSPPCKCPPNIPADRKGISAAIQKGVSVWRFDPFSDGDKFDDDEVKHFKKRQSDANERLFGEESVFHRTKSKYLYVYSN